MRKIAEISFLVTELVGLYVLKKAQTKDKIKISIV